MKLFNFNIKFSLQGIKTFFDDTRENCHTIQQSLDSRTRKESSSNKYPLKKDKP